MLRLNFGIMIETGSTTPSRPVFPRVGFENNNYWVLHFDPSYPHLKIETFQVVTVRFMMTKKIHSTRLCFLVRVVWPFDWSWIKDFDQLSAEGAFYRWWPLELWKEVDLVPSKITRCHAAFGTWTGIVTKRTSALILLSTADVVIERRSREHVKSL